MTEMPVAREYPFESKGREPLHRSGLFGPVIPADLAPCIELLGKRATWLKDDVLALVERPDLVEWVDVNSSSDWFASGAGAPESTKFRAVPIKSFGTFLDKLAAKVHTKYFENQGAVNEVLCTIR